MLWLTHSHIEGTVTSACIPVGVSDPSEKNGNNGNADKDIP